MDFFFYGTLIDADVRDYVLGPRAARISIVPGSLEGYRCVRVAGASFPGLIPDRAARTYGVIARGLGRSDMRKLVRYEGNGYRLASASAKTAGGRTLNARVFLPKPAIQLTDEEWSFAAWQEAEKWPFLTRNCPTHVTRRGT